MHEILESGNLAPGRCEGNPEKVGGAIPVNWCDFPSPPPSQGVNSRQQLSLLPPTQASLHASHDLPFFFFSPFSLFEDVPIFFPVLPLLQPLEGSRMRHPQTCRFGRRMILSQKQLRRSRYKNSSALPSHLQAGDRNSSRCSTSLCAGKDRSEVPELALDPDLHHGRGTHMTHYYLALVFPGFLRC